MKALQRKLYKFAIRVKGLDLTTEENRIALTESTSNASLRVVDALQFVDFEVEATFHEDAISTAISELEDAFPGLQIIAVKYPLATH